jgi:tetratricopeptide (TPR) repeat protein
VVNNQPELAVRVHARLLEAARYSIHDTADNMLNYARAMVQAAQHQTEREKQRTLAKVSAFIKDIKKRFNPDSYMQDQCVVEARIELLLGHKDIAVAKLQQSEELSLGKAPSPSGLLDRARAYFEAGNLLMSDHYMKELSDKAQAAEWYDASVFVMYRAEQDKYAEKRDLMIDSNKAGMEAYRRGHYSEAIRHFYQAQKAMPANANIALNLLQAISQKGRLNDELIDISHQCIDVIDKASLFFEQRQRYQLVKQNIQQIL